MSDLLDRVKGARTAQRSLSEGVFGWYVQNGLTRIVVAGPFENRDEAVRVMHADVIPDARVAEFEVAWR